MTDVVAFAAFVLSALVAVFVVVESRANRRRHASTDERLDRITSLVERMAAPSLDAERAILREIEKLEGETKLGITYIAERMGNLVRIFQDHEARIANNERITGADRVRPPPPHLVPSSPPGWLPDHAHVPDVRRTESGQHSVPLAVGEVPAKR